MYVTAPLVAIIMFNFIAFLLHNVIFKYQRTLQKDFLILPSLFRERPKVNQAFFNIYTINMMVILFLCINKLSLCYGVCVFFGSILICVTITPLRRFKWFWGSLYVFPFLIIILELYLFGIIKFN